MLVNHEAFVGHYFQFFKKQSCHCVLLMALSNLSVFILTFDTNTQLKRKSGSNQSWNIQDEIRKVRVKATEEMLKSPSSVASLEPKQSPYDLVTDMLKGNAGSLNADGGVQGVFFSLFT